MTAHPTAIGWRSALAAGWLIACGPSEPASPAEGGSLTTWQPGDSGMPSDTATVPWSTSPTTDTGPAPPPPLTLALSLPDDPPAAPFEHLELVMVHGPAGGWTLRVSGHLTGLLRDPTLLSWNGTATVAGSELANSTPVYLAVPAADDEGLVDNVYHYVDVGDSTDWMASICGLDGSLGQLDVQVEDLDDGRTAALRQPFTLRIDPIDGPYCD